MTKKEACKKARKKSIEKRLEYVNDFGDSWAFRFCSSDNIQNHSDDKKNKSPALSIILGGSFFVVNKKTGNVTKMGYSPITNVMFFKSTPLDISEFE